jgi:molybdopterin-containing oxidoreductase family membrane subunit
MAWYSNEPAELHTHLVAFFRGPNAPVFWTTLICNCLVPQILWSRRARTSVWVLWPVSILINVGMWSERFSLIVISLEEDFLPSAWRSYTPTYVDWAILFGTVAFFLFLFLAFLRLLPFIPTAEVKELAHEQAMEGHA